MKKSRGALAFLLVFLLAAASAVLAACSGSSNVTTQSKETLSVESEPVQEEEPIVLRTDPFYVLVVGDDTRKGTVHLDEPQYADGLGRSDTMMLVRVDPTEYLLTIITVPRDTEAYYGGNKVKLNEVYRRGNIDKLCDAIKDLTGVRPDYYLVTTFVGFEDLVDDLGGITVQVPIDEYMEDIVSGEEVSFGAGEQTLNGKEALVFARERHAYEAVDDGNLQEAYRQTNDRYILMTMLQQIMADPEAAADVTAKLLSHIETNWDADELAAYAEDFAANKDKVNFIRATGPYAGEIDWDINKWLAYRDEETWAQVIEVAEKGGDPSEVVPIMSLDASSSDYTEDGENVEEEYYEE